MLSFLMSLFVLCPGGDDSDMRWKDRVFAERTRSKGSPVSLQTLNECGKFSPLLETRVHVNCAWIQR